MLTGIMYNITYLVPYNTFNTEHSKTWFITPKDDRLYWISQDLHARFDLWYYGNNTIRSRTGTNMLTGSWVSGYLY